MPAAAATPAETSTRLKRSASRSLRASSFRLKNIAKATTAAMCSPLTDRRWVRPLRRMASASSRSTAFWSPVTSAIAIPAGFRDRRAAMCWRRPVRARSSPCGSAGFVTISGPIALPTAPMPQNQASREKS